MLGAIAGLAGALIGSRGGGGAKGQERIQREALQFQKQIAEPSLPVLREQAELGRWGVEGLSALSPEFLRALGFQFTQTPGQTRYELRETDADKLGRMIEYYLNFHRIKDLRIKDVVAAVQRMIMDNPPQSEEELQNRISAILTRLGVPQLPPEHISNIAKAFRGEQVSALPTLSDIRYVGSDDFRMALGETADRFNRIKTRFLQQAAQLGLSQADIAQGLAKIEGEQEAEIQRLSIASRLGAFQTALGVLGGYGEAGMKGLPVATQGIATLGASAGSNIPAMRRAEQEFGQGQIAQALQGISQYYQQRELNRRLSQQPYVPQNQPPNFLRPGFVERTPSGGWTNIR